MGLPCECSLCSLTLRLHVLKSQRAKTVLKSSRISRNLTTCLKSSILYGNLPFYPEIFQTVWKFSRLSRNLAGCLEILQNDRKSSSMSRHILDSPEHFPDCPKKLSHCPVNLPDYPEIYQTVRTYSRHSGNSRLSGHLQDY